MHSRCGEHIVATTPDLKVSRANAGSGAQLTIRGVGSSFLSVDIEQSTAIIIDGSYYSQGRIVNDAFFDLARVEILKGPQALSFGKNASAGVISVATADAGDGQEVSVRAGYELNAQQPYAEAIYLSPVSRARSDYTCSTVDAATGCATVRTGTATGALADQFVLISLPRAVQAQISFRY